MPTAQLAEAQQQPSNAIAGKPGVFTPAEQHRLFLNKQPKSFLELSVSRQHATLISSYQELVGSPLVGLPFFSPPRLDFRKRDSVESVLRYCQQHAAKSWNENPATQAESKEQRFLSLTRNLMEYRDRMFSEL